MHVVPCLCSFRNVVVPSYLGSDYTAVALAKVWTNKAKLPSIEMMQAWCNKTVEERGGYGKYFLSFNAERTAGKSFA